MKTVKERLFQLTVDNLKIFARSPGPSTSQKKGDLVDRIADCMTIIHDLH